MPAPVRVALTVEIDWADVGDSAAEWPQAEGLPPPDVGPWIASQRIGAGARPSADLGVPSVNAAGRVSGTVELSNADGRWTVGAHGADYDAALAAPHLARLRVSGTLAARQVLQVFNAQISSTTEQYAALDVTSRYPELTADRARAISSPGNVSVAALARLVAAPVSVVAPEAPEGGGGIASVTVGSSSQRADLAEARTSAHLNQLANLVCGWWFERWSGAVELRTWILQTQTAYATITHLWEVDADQSSAGLAWGLVRNEAAIRAPGVAAGQERIARSYTVAQVDGGVTPTEVVRWTPGDTTLGAIVGVTGWLSDPEWIISSEGVFLDVWSPQGYDPSDESVVTDASAGTSRQRLDRVNARSSEVRTWQGYAREDGVNSSPGTMRATVTFVAYVRRNVITASVLPTAAATDAASVAARASQGVYGVRQMPALAGSAADTVTYTNGNLVLQTLGRLSEPPRVAVLVISLWHNPAVTPAPHTLRLGDTVALAIRGLATWAGVVIGLLWSADAGQDPTVTVTVLEVVQAVPGTVPGTPRNLEVTAVTGSTTALDADWAQGSGPAPDRYRVQWRQGTSGAWSERTVTGASIRLSSLGAGTAYQVRVRAENAAGNSPYTPPTLGTTGTAEPATPTGLTVTPVAGSATQLDADWAQGSGPAPDRYRVQWRQGASGAWSERTVTGTSVRLSSLGADTAYQVRVRAENAAGSSAYTAPVSARTNAPAPPAGLSALSVEDVVLAVEAIELWVNQPSVGPPPPDRMPTFGQATVADQVYTAGTAISDLVLPQAAGGDAPLSYSLSPALPGGLTFTAGTRTISGTPTAAAAAATYTWTATDADGDTAALTFRITVAAAVAPGPPTAAAAQPANGRATMSWTAPTIGGAPARYRCQYRTAAVGQTPAGSWTGTRVVTGTSVTFFGLTNGTRYDLQVRAENAAGDSAWVVVADVLVAAPPPTLAGPVLRIATNLLSSNNLVQMAWSYAAPAGYTATGRYDSEVGRAFASSIQGHTDFRWDLPIRNNAATSRWLQGAGLTRLEFRVRAHLTRTADNSAVLTDWATMVLLPAGQSIPSPVVVAAVNDVVLEVSGIPLVLHDGRTD